MAGTAIEVFSHSKTEDNDSDSIQQDWEDASQHLHDNEECVFVAFIDMHSM